MRRAYSFLACGKCTDTGHDLDALCIFFDTSRPITKLDFFDELLSSLRLISTLPDCVVVIADESNWETLYQYWVDNPAQRETFQNRGSRKHVQFVKNYYFVSWAPQTGVCLAQSNNKDEALGFTLPIEQFVYQGLSKLVATNPVVQLAPSGHVFKHPSKTTVNKLFIRARELATCEAELAFIGRCLTLTFPLLSCPELAQVYTDTMGVYPFIREALNFSNNSAPIHSYHSYDDLSQLLPPTDEYAVVISASTSGGMAKKLHVDQGFDPDHLLTIIDVTRHNRNNHIAVALEDIDTKYLRQITHGSETQIELDGGHFSVKSKPPREVTLGIKHGPKCLDIFLRQFGIDGLTGINAGSATSSEPRLIALNREIVGSAPQLVKWLDREIAWSVSVSIDHVVHAGDAGSKAMAEQAADRLLDLKGGPNRPTTISHEDVEIDTLSSAQGVLVVQAVAGDGGLLREISRDFREFLKTDIPRHFLVGVGLPQDNQVWQHLRQFLVKNASSREYGFSAWLVMPIGPDGTNNAWEALSSLVTAAQTEKYTGHDVPTAVATASIDKAIKCANEGFNGFLPTNTGNELGLSEGFVFFGDVFNDNLDNVLSSTTYATVASVLQAARDINDPIRQLRPSGYESVVLAPENFLRFNDDLLQACILRAAYPSELDYSSSPSLSRLMKEFLLKIFRRNGHPYGAASLEFAAALACGRLKLANVDCKELQSKAIRELADEPTALLGFLCLIK